MNYETLLQLQDNYMDLDEIVEPEINSLRVVIDHYYNGKPVEEYVPFQLDFDCYIAYSVENESIGIDENGDDYSGKPIRLYLDSKYMDYIKSTTIAEEYIGDVHFPEEKMKHYMLCCLNHTVSIISYEEPKVTIIDRAIKEN